MGTSSSSHEIQDPIFNTRWFSYPKSSDRKYYGTTLHKSGKVIFESNCSDKCSNPTCKKHFKTEAKPIAPLPDICRMPKKDKKKHEVSEPGLEETVPNRPLEEKELNLIWQRSGNENISESSEASSLSSKWKRTLCNKCGFKVGNSKICSRRTSQSTNKSTICEIPHLKYRHIDLMTFNKKVLVDSSESSEVPNLLCTKCVGSTIKGSVETATATDTSVTKNSADTVYPFKSISQTASAPPTPTLTFAKKASNPRIYGDNLTRKDDLDLLSLSNEREPKELKDTKGHCSKQTVIEELLEPTDASAEVPVKDAQIQTSLSHRNSQSTATGTGSWKESEMDVTNPNLLFPKETYQNMVMNNCNYRCPGKPPRPTADKGRHGRTISLQKVHELEDCKALVPITTDLQLLPTRKPSLSEVAFTQNDVESIKITVNPTGKLQLSQRTRGSKITKGNPVVITIRNPEGNPLNLKHSDRVLENNFGGKSTYRGVENSTGISDATLWNSCEEIPEESAPQIKPLRLLPSDLYIERNTSNDLENTKYSNVGARTNNPIESVYTNTQAEFGNFTLKSRNEHLVSNEKPKSGDKVYMEVRNTEGHKKSPPEPEKMCSATQTTRSGLESRSVRFQELGGASYESSDKKSGTTEGSMSKRGDSVETRFTNQQYKHHIQQHYRCEVPEKFLSIHRRQFPFDSTNRHYYGRKFNFAPNEYGENSTEKQFQYDIDNLPKSYNDQNRFIEPEQFYSNKNNVTKPVQAKMVQTSIEKLYHFGDKIPKNFNNDQRKYVELSHCTTQTENEISEAFNESNVNLQRCDAHVPVHPQGIEKPTLTPKCSPRQVYFFPNSDGITNYIDTRVPQHIQRRNLSTAFADLRFFEHPERPYAENIIDNCSSPAFKSSSHAEKKFLIPTVARHVHRPRRHHHCCRFRRISESDPRSSHSGSSKSGYVPPYHKALAMFQRRTGERPRRLKPKAGSPDSGKGRCAKRPGKQINMRISVVDGESEVEDQVTKMNGVNGINGHGDLNGSGGELISQNLPKGCWTIGLINSKFRYLTAETFGFKINGNGASLKKKQIWTLEPCSASGADSTIFLRSHLGKYLAVDSFGNVTCEAEERDPGSKFQISVADDGTGRWALRNVTRGYFLGASSDKLTCTAKVPGDAELWHVHLAARPQVNLRSVGRKRFAHLSENLDEIHVDANIPWGEDTLFTLEFRVDESGKYALHTCNNKYLSREGKLVDICNPNCLFSAEYHSGQLALRDRQGAYLSPIGSKAVLKSRSQTVTKDELFSLEDSLPQASFVAALNGRYVSVKQGVDVTANQDEISDHETFQLEFDGSTKRWYIRTMQDRYWTLETGGGIQACGDKRSSNALFDLVWQGDGSVGFRANNGKFISTKRSGHLYANCDTVEDNAKYFFYLINRPILVLKCEQGFVGYKSATSPKLECNKATYETIQVERSEKGVVFFKGQNGKYWHVDGESVTADSDTPEGFFLELRDPTRICIKSVSGEYLVASKNGSFRLGDTDYENATKWEY